MRFSQISLGALALALATPAMADTLPADPAPALTDAKAPADAPVATVTDPAATAEDPAPAAPAPAADGDTAPPPAFTLNGGATVVSDYRFRGLSQTNIKPALQGSLTVTHSSGIYLSVWGSSIDDYVADFGDQELDLIGGWKKTFKSGTTLDIGVLYYWYPGSDQGCGCKYYSDFFEPYIALSHTIGPVTAKATINYAPSQRALALGGKNQDNLYGALDFSVGVPKTPVSFSAHLGHNFEKSFLSTGRTYTDWGVGMSIAWKQFSIGVSYVDTDLPKNWATSFTGKDIAKPGVVATVGVSF